MHKHKMICCGPVQLGLRGPMGMAYAMRSRDCGPGGGGGYGFGGPGGFGGWGRGRGHRARRGDIRAAILSLLADQPRNGYQLMTELEQRSKGMWRPSPGSIYPALQQLEDEGLIAAESARAGRTFTLTEAGRAHLAQQPEGEQAPWETMGIDQEVMDLFSQVKHIGMAVGQIAHLEGESKVAEAKKILAQTRRALYRILAEDDESEPTPEG
ncbi:MAG TPA: PadR family transcriptional regulator [bacterium]|nr:PadR family transcriptional regulator [bacterium]